MNPVEDYIKACPQEHQERLFALRGIILQAAPQLQEKISWGMPTFYLKKNVIHFALHKAHTGIYPGVAAMVQFAERISPYKSSKGAFQLPHIKPLPEELLADLTRWCAQHPGL